jgi:hypothetical protein
MRAELLDLLATLEEESGLPRLFGEGKDRAQAARAAGRQILDNFESGAVFRRLAEKTNDPQKRRRLAKQGAQVLHLVNEGGLSPSAAWSSIQESPRGPGYHYPTPAPEMPPQEVDKVLENRRHRNTVEGHAARTAASNVVLSEVAAQTFAEKRAWGMRQVVLTDPRTVKAAEAEQKQRQVAAGKAAADPTHVRAIALMTARQQPTFSAEDLPRQTAAVRKLFSENYKVALRDASR